MKLNIYTDDTFREVREVKEAERMKIPFRVARHVARLLPTLSSYDKKEIPFIICENEDQVAAIIQATFGLSEEDLDHVETLELGDLAKEIIQYVIEKMNELGVRLGDSEDPNPQTPATTA